MNLRAMKPSLVVAALVTLSLHGTAFAKPGAIQEGKPLPTVSATAATGNWLQRAAFNPESYGKVRGVSPAGSLEPKIVLYTSALNEDFFKIATAVDTYIASNPELAWSYVLVTDTKGAQLGGYTADELRVRLGEIQTLAKKHGITHLSFLVAAPGSHNTHPPTTVVMAHITPSDTLSKSGKPVKSALVDWVTEMPAETLQGDVLAKQISSMDETIHIRK